MKLIDLLERPEGEGYRGRVTRTTAGGMPYFRCRCGRETPVDMMRELPDLPALAGKDRFRCDGCWTRWLREGVTTEKELKNGRT